MVMPAELRLRFADGTNDIVRLPVDMWNLGYQFTYRVPPGRHVTQAEVDPHQALPDIQRSNNLWEEKR